jgi:general secretion pathway protein D
MLVIQIQFADVAVLSNNLNNLLSEGAVSRPSTAAARAGTTTGQTGTAQSQTAEAATDVIYTWQSATAARRTTTGGGMGGTTVEQPRPINNLIGQVRIVPDVRSQKLIIAAPSIYFDSIKLLVAELDKPEPQVQLETYIVRIDTEGALRIGWRWMPDASSLSAEELDNAIVALGDMGFMDTFAKGGTYVDKTLQNLGGNTPPLGTDPRNWQPINKPSPVGVTGRPIVDTFHGGTLGSWSNQLAPGRGILSADVNLALLVQLLVKNRNASVVAHPQITVNNNEQGTVFVGEDVPFETGIVTSTEGRSAQTTVEYREVGTRLEITPKINKQGRVVLNIAIENSRRKPELLNGRALTELQTYNTQLTVENGQKVWLGGLSEQRVENIIRKFPILGDIPILGFLFRKTDKTTLDSKIYAFVTPSVLDTAAQADTQFIRASKEIDAYRKEFEKLQLKMPGGYNELTSSTGTLKPRAAIPPVGDEKS